MQKLLLELASLFGPSGQEEKVRSYLLPLLEPLVDKVTVDSMGNLIAEKNGPGPRVMLSAHLDEVGLMVTHRDDRGFLRFAPVGGISPLALCGARMCLADGTPAVVASEPLSESSKLSLEKLYLDLGEAAPASCQPGSMTCFATPPALNGTRVLGKALDNRAGCTVLVEVLRRLANPRYHTCFVFTVQEEVGARGARTAAYALEPEWAVAVDVTYAGDTPGSKGPELTLGGGPTILVKDGSLLAHPRVRQHLAEAAQGLGQAFQWEVLPHGGTDAGSIHLVRQGVPSGVISLPCRYTHSPCEVVDMGDLEGAVRILVKALQS